MYFLVTPPLIKGTNVWIHLGDYISPKMLFLMNKIFLFNQGKLALTLTLIPIPTIVTIPLNVISPTLPTHQITTPISSPKFTPPPYTSPIHHSTTSTSLSSHHSTTLPSTASSTIDPNSSPSPSPPPPPPTTNHHTMLTRSKTGSLKPPLFPNINLTTTEPTSIQQALATPCWAQAMKLEYDALIANNTWQLTTLPPGKTLVGCKWIFRIKENPDGSINKYKARLVAKGFTQKYGFDYTDTFAPDIKPVTVRTVLTLALTYKWTIQQLDVHNAFLNGQLHDDVYMAQPPGFNNNDKSIVCKLNKAIYGLKQAPRALV